jgi:hypothetical protein
MSLSLISEPFSTPWANIVNQMSRSVQHFTNDAGRCLECPILYLADRGGTEVWLYYLGQCLRVLYIY